MRLIRSYCASVLAAAALSAAEPAEAQSFLLPATPEKGVWIEAARADFKGFEAAFPSTTWFISGRLPVTPRLSATVDVPFSYARLDVAGADSETSSVFGNPYVGAEFAAVPDRLTLEAGLRLPLNTADSESFADVLAVLADPQRMEAFMDNTVPVTVAASLEHAVSNVLSLRGRAGIMSAFYTGDDAPDTDVAVDYGAVGTYTAGPARVALGFSGRWFTTADEGGFGENSLHHVGLGADVKVGRVRPGVSVRIPLDGDYRDVLGSSIGVYLQVPLR
jgi:hypothetical protein